MFDGNKDNLKLDVMKRIIGVILLILNINGLFVCVILIKWFLEVF